MNTGHGSPKPDFLVHGGGVIGLNLSATATLFVGAVLVGNYGWKFFAAVALVTTALLAAAMTATMKVHREIHADIEDGTLPDESADTMAAKFHGPAIWLAIALVVCFALDIIAGFDISILGFDPGLAGSDDGPDSGYRLRYIITGAVHIALASVLTIAMARNPNGADVGKQIIFGSTWRDRGPRIAPIEDIIEAQTPDRDTILISLPILALYWWLTAFGVDFLFEAAGLHLALA